MLTLLDLVPESLTYIESTFRLRLFWTNDQIQIERSQIQSAMRRPLDGLPIKEKSSLNGKSGRFKKLVCPVTVVGLQKDQTQADVEHTGERHLPFEPTLMRLILHTVGPCCAINSPFQDRSSTGSVEDGAFSCGRSQS